MEIQMKSEKSPLTIYNPGDKHGEYFNLNSPYTFTLEECITDSQDLYHSMIAPGYFQGHNWSLRDVYHPELRPLHRHNSIELMYVIKGEVIQYIEDFQHVYTEGECCILNKNIRHVESYSSDFEAVFLLLSDKFLLDAMTNSYFYDTNLNKHNHMPSIYKELQDLLKEDSAYKKEYLDLIPVQNKTETRDIMQNIFGELILETRQQNPGFYQISSGYLARLLAFLSDANYYQLHKMNLKNSNEDYIFNRVTIYLEKNNGRIDFQELETLMHYTKDYLNRVIKRHSGMTLTEYSQKICLEKAAYDLTNSDKSISQIIHELNYTNRTYFYRIFNEKYGMTPTEYRKNNI